MKDLHGYIRALGLSPHPVMPTASRRRRYVTGAYIMGNFFLAGKAGGGEFTREDEEVLVLFAAQPDLAGNPLQLTAMEFD